MLSRTAGVLDGSMNLGTPCLSANSYDSSRQKNASCGDQTHEAANKPQVVQQNLPWQTAQSGLSRQVVDLNRLHQKSRRHHYEYAHTLLFGVAVFGNKAK